jgi:hypothetical protein
MIEIILIIVVLYLGLGAVFVIPFLIKGIQKVDEGTKGSTIGFKIMIIPGSIVFWPVLMKKWLKAQRVLKSKINSTI